MRLLRCRISNQLMSQMGHGPKFSLEANLVGTTQIVDIDYDREDFQFPLGGLPASCT